MNSGKFIRGLRQFKAMLYFIEEMWLVLIGRDTRDIEEWEKEFIVWNGIKFRKDRFRCAMRELEIITGFAKPYRVVFAPSFWESLERLVDNEEIDLPSIFDPDDPN